MCVDMCLAGLSATGSAVVSDAVSAAYAGTVDIGGARFVGGFDDYAAMWRQHGFARGLGARHMADARVDRSTRAVQWMDAGGTRGAVGRKGQMAYFFVEVEK